MGLRGQVILLLLLLGAAPYAPARAASSLRVGVDPRFELLGVVQRLAGLGEPAQDLFPSWEDLSRRFGPWQSHPAVKAYAAQASRRPGEEGYGMVFFFLSDPPSLSWTVPRASLPSGLLDSLGGIEELERFLSLMREFARDSRFMDFYREHQKAYAGYEAAARRELGARDYLPLMESYLRQDLDCRLTVILPLLYSRSRFTSFIWPYPYQGPKRKGKGPFQAFTIHKLPESRNARPYFGLANFLQSGDGYEPLYIPVEWGFVDAEEEIRGLSALYQPVARDCPPPWDACAKHLIISALSLRMSKRLLGADLPLPDSPTREYVKALSARLVEFETRKERYPDFQSFFPRLVEEMRTLALHR